MVYSESIIPLALNEACPFSDPTPSLRLKPTLTPEASVPGVGVARYCIAWLGLEVKTKYYYCYIILEMNQSELKAIIHFRKK